MGLSWFGLDGSWMRLRGRFGSGRSFGSRWNRFVMFGSERYRRLRNVFVWLIVIGSWCCRRRRRWRYRWFFSFVLSSVWFVGSGFMVLFCGFVSIVFFVSCVWLLYLSVFIVRVSFCGGDFSGDSYFLLGILVLVFVIIDILLFNFWCYWCEDWGWEFLFVFSCYYEVGSFCLYLVW